MMAKTMMMSSRCVCDSDSQTCCHSVTFLHSHQNLDDQKAWFKIVDTNNDEKISPEELRASFASVKSEDKGDSNEADVAFASMDQNGDGFISIGEWHAFYLQAPQDPEYENGERVPLSSEQRKHFRQQFDSHDLDKSGSLSLAEFTALAVEEDPERTEAFVKSLFLEIDADKSGFVSFEEWTGESDVGEGVAAPLPSETSSDNQNSDTERAQI